MSTYRTIDAKAELLGGIVDAAAELNDRIIDANAELVTEIRATTYPDYTGEYNVTPTEEAQQLNTAETVLLENVTVDAIPADYVGSGVTRQSELSVSGLTVTAGAGYYEEAVSETVTPNLQSASESYTPTESAQTDTITYDQDHDGLSSVEITVGAIPADYVGSEIPRRDALSVSGATVSGAAGYYDETVSATVSSGSATTPDTSITANPSISVGSDGLISASVSKTQSVTPTVQEGYVTTGTAGNVTVSGSNTSQLPTQAGTTITPSTSVQTAVPAGKFTTGDVKVAAMTNATWKAGSILQPTPSISVDENGLITASVYESTSVQPLSASGYAEKTKWYSVIVNESNTSQLSTQAGTTITPTTSEQTAVAAGKYTTGAVKVAAMPSGTEGTPVATKGAVSGHSVSVTPSVTNAAGYIAGGTKTGTAVTVAASELVSGTKSISANGTGIDVTNYAAVDVAVPGPALQTKSVTPTESAQAITPDAGYYGLDEVDVGAISSTYVGSGIARNDSTDLSASGATVTAPAGYYEEAATKSVASGSAKTPATSITANPSISVDANGLITAAASASKNVTPTVTAGYVSAGTAGTVTVSGSNTSQLSTQAGTTITPTTSEQTAVAAGKYTTGAVKVAAMPSGTAGTPTASKGAVSGHAVTVTPSVTNTTGYITGGTKTGTGVSVSASELVSGTKSITANGTGIDVTNYAAVDVSVSGGAPVLETVTKSYTPTESAQSETITPGAGYDGIGEVDVSVGAISSTYVGSGVARRDSTNLSASGATVTAPAGYYENNATKTVASGSATAPGTISGTSATVSTGTNTLTLSKTVSVTPSVTAGWVSSGTAGNSQVSLTASVTTQAAQTIHPSTTDQTISSGRYLTGTQTFKAVTTSNLTADNVKNGVVVTVGDADDADRILSVTGTYSGGGGSSKNAQTAQSTSRSTSSTYTEVISLTCTKAGTYNVYWSTFRSSTSGTWGSQLYLNDTAYGSAQTGSWSNHIQNIHLSNVSITANADVAVRVRSRGSNYYGYVGTLTIIEV